MQEDLADFQQFMRRRNEVARAYVRGDAAPLGEIVTRGYHATFFGPQGSFDQGAEEVAEAYRSGATAFEPGGDSTIELLHIAASDEIAYWVGIQRAQMRMRDAEARAGAREQDSDALVPIALRVTEVFRREGGGWKLVHRHADALAERVEKT